MAAALVMVSALSSARLEAFPLPLALVLDKQVATIKVALTKLK